MNDFLVFRRQKTIDKKPLCHPERSEGSFQMPEVILRYAQDDKYLR